MSQLGEFSITATGDEMLLIGNALVSSDLPYKQVTALINKLQQQVNEQLAAPQGPNEVQVSAEAAPEMAPSE